MAEITANMVRDLREKTDAPMMECKRALAEAGGDPAKAEEILRIKLGNKASKAASRITAEGIVTAHVGSDGRIGALLEVNCETDFVAKNAEFVAFAAAVAALVAREAPADVAALSTLTLESGNVEEIRRALVGKIGENITIRRFARLAARGRLYAYVHGGSKIGAMVDVIGGDEALGKDLAMHIAASKPVALDDAEVPAALVQKERDIAAAKAAESGKPTNIVQKMVEGSVQKFLKEVTLLGQPFVKNDKQTVAQLLKSKGASVSGFALFVVGEGLERRKDDFAAEVMAQVGSARNPGKEQARVS
ncbi:MAG TPA: translation elongation factor Ts [Burkholderiales bacterium]|nr:translation elongation factor Ts [Burkholderiales bacterium]